MPLDESLQWFTNFFLPDNSTALKNAYSMASQSMVTSRLWILFVFVIGELSYFKLSYEQNLFYILPMNHVSLV